MKDLIKVRVYLRDKTLDFKATDVELNRITDELDIRQDKTLIARFFIRNIVGYTILSEDG
jgi:hypothetical protein